jgi:lipopolysaccharide export system protein LptA
MVLFGAAFGVYARFLGWIDGLPEMPDDLLARMAANDQPPDISYTPVETKLQQAFGQDCAEIGYSFKIEMRARGMVLAAHDIGIDAEGRVKLSPFSLAMFKVRPGQSPEINTVHSDVALLTFERPVKTLAEIGERRIVGCELESDPHTLSHDPRRGMIFVVNNRSTPTTDDDLVLETPGPVYYREAAQANLPLDKARPQIWTAAAVRMVDHRNAPDSTTITAQGMQIFLAVDSPEQQQKNAQAQKAKSKSSSVSGVRRVILPSNVAMNLWMDPKEGFLATGAKPQQPPAADKPAERSHVLITTLGQFTYDVLAEGDRARFDRLPPSANQLGDCVHVVRPLIRGPEGQLNDQLECDTLELQFTQKAIPGQPPPATPLAAKPAAPPDDRQSISWAHAWGQFIILTSDAEKLEAHGDDLFYDAKTKGTTLKGTPQMVAVKDGNEIHAPELLLYGAEAQEGRHAEAHGAGYLRLLDRAGTKRTVEARWKELMVYRQEPAHDLVTLTGDGVFEDRENNQFLRADLLKLWLEPAPKPAPGSAPAKPPAAGEQEEPRKIHPQRLEATGRVVARSPDLTVHDTEQLVLLFKDAPPGPPTKPGTPAPPQPTGPSSPWTTPLPTGPTPPAFGTPGQPSPAPRQPAAQQQQPKKPIDLSARTVQAFIIRRGEENDLDTVHCEDDVKVHQDPVPPQEKPTDMRGKSLKLVHTANGNILTVTGTVTGPNARPGEVHLPDVSLIGPQVVIDQVENVVDVAGLGSMRMVSATDFEGKKLTKPTPIDITWMQGMRFTGKQAVFRGNVQAVQENTTLLCQTMQVDLNRPISLSQRANEPGAGREPANVDKVICDAGPDRPQGVIITDVVRDGDRVTGTRQIEADEVLIHKEEGWMDATNHGTGRGNVRIVQLGPKGEPEAGQPRTAGGRPAPAKGPPAGPQETEWKLTWVKYTGTMKVNNQTRVVTFYNGVDLIHLPVDSPDRLPSFDATINKLPTGALYLRSNVMRVYSSKDANGQTRQMMVASGRANVTWGDQFFGSADEIHYDEAKQTLILIGQNGNFARARRLATGGGDKGEIKGQKLRYDRLNDIITGDGTYSITGQ